MPKQRRMKFERYMNRCEGYIYVHATTKGTLSAQAHWYDPDGSLNSYSLTIRKSQVYTKLDEDNLSNAVDFAFADMAEAMIAHAESIGLELY